MQNPCIRLLTVPKETLTREQYNKHIEDSDSFETPPELFKLADELAGGLNLDVAACWENTRCIYHLTDGLRSPWLIYSDIKSRVWCNPPYGDVTPWIKKGISEKEKGNTVIIVYLLRFDPSTIWFNLLCKHTRIIYVLTERRIRFVGRFTKSNGTYSKNTSSTYPHALYIL